MNLTLEEKVKLLIEQNVHNSRHFDGVWEWQDTFEDRVMRLEAENEKQGRVTKALESIARSLEILAEQKTP
jgi:hypothetical protein